MYFTLTLESENAKEKCGFPKTTCASPSSFLVLNLSRPMAKIKCSICSYLFDHGYMKHRFMI